jgi:muramidase (phage lysozyme)
VTPNIAAFLAMLAHSEGTDRAADPYRVCYGFKHTISDLAFHPAEPRLPDWAVEWPGESIAKLGPQYFGEVSTAAGRYQINLPTYLDNKRELTLSGFDGAAQNDMAINILRRVGALADIVAGSIPGAIQKCRNKWASLPGGNSNQPEHDLAYLTGFYMMAGGSLVGLA